MQGSSDSGWKSRHWDAIVIGGGHNGLICAAYLARSGLSTLVLERRGLVGGAAVTEELVPGFRFSRAAYVNSLLRPSIIRELELKKHGFAMLPRNPSSFTPLLQGGHLLLGPDAELNRREIGRFSKRDAERFPLYEARLDRMASFLEPMLDRPPPELFSQKLSRKAAGAWQSLQLGARALRLKGDLPGLLEILAAPARKILESWFESEPLLGTLATDAIIGALISPSTPGSGYVLFHHVMGETDGARGVWGYVRGGMGALSEAIASSARASGARIETGQAVHQVLLEGGAARGVALADGTELRCRAVFSSADPHVTFLRLLPAGCLPEEFEARIRGLDFSSAVTKINLALDRIPDFAALPGDRPGPQHRGTIHLVSSLPEIELAYQEALAGKCSTRPVIEMTIPSALDDSLAPPGKHVASLFVQYTPYRLKEGSWSDPKTKEAFADRVFKVIEEFAPGFTASVLARDVLSPLDLETIFGLTGGNIFHGAMGLDQLFWLRPAPGWSSHRTPIAGLYLCGSGAHPGGGVLGSPGRNAARVGAGDLRRG